MANTEADTVSSTTYLAGFIAGGLLLGAGIRSLYWSFGWDRGCLNCDMASVGFSGLDNLGLLSAADYSVGLVVMGVLLLVGLNAGAWRRTNGY